MPRIEVPVPDDAIALPIVGKHGVGWNAWVSKGRVREVKGLRLALDLQHRNQVPRCVTAFKREGVWFMKAPLHRLLFPHWKLIDHVMGDPTDNRDHMLRPATRAQNMANSVKMANCSSRFKGVSRRRSGRWEARIFVCGKLRCLGTFNDEIEAARVYDKAAVECWGEFAAPNFPDEHPIILTA